MEENSAWFQPSPAPGCRGKLQLWTIGMASNHLVISKLQHLLENSSIADVHEEMTLSLMASPQEISLVHIRCFADALCNLLTCDPCIMFQQLRHRQLGTAIQSPHQGL
ncbi:hypothetical protein MHYP_G00115620 [Metynnis hypsauchen]